MINLTGNDGLLLLVLLLFIVGDKFTTYLCVNGVKHNFPEASANSVETNIMAKWLLDKFGNLGGNAVMTFVSLLMAWVILFCVKLGAVKLGHIEYLNYAIYAILIIYGFVIANNTYYALKYNKII
jgi:hypothetical protein